MVDTDGRGLVLEPQPADVQDRDGALPVLRLQHRLFPFVVKTFADASYARHRLANATTITVEIVRKPPSQVALPCIPVDGWLNASSRGSAETVDFGKITKRPRIR
jgi:hypothetical protein